jgi:hypothetical protein
MIDWEGSGWWSEPVGGLMDLSPQLSTAGSSMISVSDVSGR